MKYTNSTKQKTKSLLFIMLTCLILISCGDDQAKASPVTNIIACDVLDEKYIKNKYPDADKITIKPRDVSMSSSCTYTFKVNKLSYYIKTQFHYGNSEDTLKASIRNRGDNGIPLSGVGKMAFQDIDLGQVNIWNGLHVFQINVSDGKKYNIDIAKEIAKDILAML